MTPQTIIIRLAGALLFLISLQFIADVGGLSCSTEYFSTRSPKKPFSKDRLYTITPVTWVLFPWRSNVETLPVSTETPLNIIHGDDKDRYSLSLIETIDPTSSTTRILVTARRLDPGTKTTTSHHLGILLHCLSGQQWIQWLDGDLTENYTQANNRAQNACEQVVPHN